MAHSKEMADVDVDATVKERIKLTLSMGKDVEVVVGMGVVLRVIVLTGVVLKVVVGVVRKVVLQGMSCPFEFLQVRGVVEISLR